MRDDCFKNESNAVFGVFLQAQSISEVGKLEKVRGWWVLGAHAFILPFAGIGIPESIEDSGKTIYRKRRADCKRLSG